MIVSTTVPEPLLVIWSVRQELHQGRSLSMALEMTCARRTTLFAKSLKSWLARIEAGQKSSHITHLYPILAQTPSRQALLLVLEKGLSGASIDEFLHELEKEFLERAELSFEKHLQLLPLKLLIPLTLFILPAVMALLVGPFLMSFKDQF